jgi:FkbM family methyltransferase
MKTITTDLGTFKLFNQDVTTLANGRAPNQDIIDQYISPHLENARLMIYVGAEQGISSFYVAKKYQSLCVYAFEPRDRYFCMLMNTLELNQCENIVGLNNILGHMNGMIKVPPAFKCPIPCDYDDVIDLGQGNIVSDINDFCVVTMDSLQLVACDVIYIDFPGLEYLVLLGGIRTIQQFKPTICFHVPFYDNTEFKKEFYENIGIKETSMDTFELLKRLEYSVTEVEPSVYMAVSLSLQREQVESLVDVSQDVVPDAT